jgi:hypothetical protein
MGNRPEQLHIFYFKHSPFPVVMTSCHNPMSITVSNPFLSRRILIHTGRVHVIMVDSIYRKYGGESSTFVIMRQWPSQLSI